MIERPQGAPGNKNAPAWSVISAATLMTAAPMLLAFLLLQRRLVQSFMRAGVR